jgi:hypothetical protein
MASHAIGDVESLLEASGLSNGEGDKADGLEEEIRRLVIDSLTGKDVPDFHYDSLKALADAVERE